MVLCGVQMLITLFFRSDWKRSWYTRIEHFQMFLMGLYSVLYFNLFVPLIISNLNGSNGGDLRCKASFIHSYLGRLSGRSSNSLLAEAPWKAMGCWQLPQLMATTYRAITFKLLFLGARQAQVITVVLVLQFTVNGTPTKAKRAIKKRAKLDAQKSA